MENILYPKRNKYGKRFRGKSAESINLSHPKGHSRVQTVHLLKFENTELTKVFSCRSEQRFGIIVELFFGIRRMHKGNDCKHHSLISRC